MPQKEEIVLFHYTFSPYAQRVVWYLTLRGIEYSQCMQPVAPPREDLSALGIAYRRIPLLAIGRDIYADTRLILDKLEAKYPDGALGASAADRKGVEKLLEKWIIDGGVFLRCTQAMPPDLPLLKDANFVKDREEYTGRSWAKEAIAKMRPEALNELRDMFTFLETTLLADGRDWILRTEKPSLADINTIWPLLWMTGIPGALPPDLISEKQFPKVYGWFGRFKSTINSAKSTAPKPKTLKGAEAVKQIVAAEFTEPEGQVDEGHPLGLEKGQNIEVWPTDSGFTRRDQGRLCHLTAEEVVLETQSKIGERVIRLHTPLHGFRVAKATGGAGSKL
ncbi:MAG: hypothetical protein M1827_004730 [Pycnora praestabilis]|nr:MAG: hypothetical protein M1827_004730 [Pycnora praestabilis]